MSIIDRYIIKKFLGTFFYAIVLIIVIVIVFDISERIDDFLRHNAPLKNIVFDYYFNFIPYFINLFSPLFTFIAVIFFTSKLASRTEIIAILSNGVSFKRLMLPYLFSAVILAMLSFYLSNFLIPPANKKRMDFEYKYFRKKATFSNRNIHLQIKPGTFAFIESYNFDLHIGYGFALETFNEDNSYSKITAKNARWDTVNNLWQLENYTMRKLKDLNETAISGTSLDTLINLTPADLELDVRNMEIMNYTELREFIAQERIKGSEGIVFYEVEKHRRIANPFATIILTFIGMSLSSRKVRGGIGMHLGAGLLISFSYILFMQITTTFATYGNLSPFISVWIPNVLFGLLGLFLLKTAPK